MKNKSEVAQLREQLDLEIEAMARMSNNVAMVASHKIISHRYNRLGALCTQLEQHVEPAEVMKWVVERLDQA